MNTSRLVLLSAVALYFAQPVLGDVYMHNPAGSNNRACRNDNNQNRRNGNRLFDSQNNDAGGYPCRRSYPIRSYEGRYPDGQNGNANANDLDADGNLKLNGLQGGQNTERQYFYAGSQLTSEWTVQHGCGTNPKVKCAMVMQYACEDTMPLLRDGTPVNNNDGNNLNDEASDTIPNNNNNNAQNDFRYGRHETLASYQSCTNRQRNTELFTADQNLQGNTAQYTRQNPNGNRNGLECPEESEYYPYWGVSEWKDLSILADDLSDCAYFQAESQNVKARGECNGANGDQPITEAACVAAGGTWTVKAAWGLPPPVCAQGEWSRDNHLGTSGGAGTDYEPGRASRFNITIPDDMAGKGRCTLRLRYNISTTDTNQRAPITDDKSIITIYGTAADNDGIYDRNNNEAKTYVAVAGAQGNTELSFAINTNQLARTFQDRSHTFEVVAAPAAGRTLQTLPATPGVPNGEGRQPTNAACAGKKIVNLNTAGKRGNIVQVYPSVEYTTVPDVTVVKQGTDCVHVQFTGTDYNQNRNPNNAEGGPPHVNNGNQAKADRSNIVQTGVLSSSFPALDTAAPEFTAAKMFDEPTDNLLRVAFSGQDVTNTAECKTIAQLQQDIPGNNAGARAKRGRSSYNCAKMNNAATPYFDGGLLQAGSVGVHGFTSTRNSNFSNRQQKGNIVVLAAAPPPTAAPAPVAGTNNGADAAPAPAPAPAPVPPPGAAPGLGGGIPVAVPSPPPTYPGSSYPNPPTGATTGTSASRGQNADEGGDFNYVITGAVAGVGTLAVLIAFVAFRRSRAGGDEHYSGATVIAKHAYTAKEAGELSFQVGDEVTILRQDGSGWWEGETANGARGVFPANFI